MSEGTEIKIKGKKIAVSIDGLTPMEISGLARKIEDEMARIETESNIVDTYKQITLVALNYAAELYIREKNLNILKEADSARIDGIISKLEKNLRDETLF